MNTGNHSSILKIILLTIIVWLTVFATAFSQEYIFDTELINVKDGLPHRNTYATTQDKEGFIWVSTLAGISRYDGYQFKTYLNSDLHIPDTDAARHFAIDIMNRLWYSSTRSWAYSGLINHWQDSVYTMETVSKGRFGSRDVLYVGNSKASGDDVLIAVRSGIVYSYDGDFTEIYRSPRPFSGIVLCETLPDGSHWITHGSEVMRVKNGTVVQTVKAPRAIKKIVTAYPELIMEVHSTRENPADIRYWRLEKSAFIPFTIAGYYPQDIKAVHISRDYSYYFAKQRMLIQDRWGNTVYTLDGLTSTLYDAFPAGLENTFSDRQDMLWLTTWKGLAKIRFRKNPFKDLGIKNSIRGMYLEDEQLWAGNIVKNIASGAQKRFSEYPASSFYKDYRGQLWISTEVNILLKHIPGTNNYTRYYFNANASSYLVFQNAVTQNYWVGTDNGLYRFDPKAGKFTPFPLPKAPLDRIYIRQCYQNQKGIWIVSNTGIFLMDANTETIIRHYTTADNLPFNNLNHLYEDDKGIFWLGTKGGGLVRWDLTTNDFRQYTRNDKLSNNNIYAVYEDNFETLWLPSDYGLMAFDKNTETVRVYLPRHGIAHEEFNTFGHFKDSEGRLYFGGMNGLVSFDPGDLQKQTVTSSPLYATKVRVLEKDAETFTDKTAEYTETKEINLQSDDRILEVALILLDYEKSVENRYAYKLAGNQEQWIYTDDNTLSIINPPYGRYTLEVKARGASGQWSEKPLAIPMYVKRPFYLQWWFIFTSISVLIAGVFAIIRWRTQKLRKDRERLENEVQKRTQKIAEQAEDLKALDKAKSRFFTNITHEFRTPLTLIGGPVEQIIAADIPSPLRGQAKIIKSNAKHLTGLINQLLDISRLESGQMEIKTSTIDIVAFTRELVQVFSSLADEKKQKLIYRPAVAAWETRFDTEKYSEIIYNLLSNALKYTPEKAIIELLLSKDADADKEYIRIKVKDNGTGIAEEALPHIFDRFYQVDDSTTRKGKGTGIGLALVKELVALMNGEITVASEVSKGTVFTVRLPVLPYTKKSEASVEISTLEIPPVWYETGTLPGEKQAPEISEENKLELLIIEDHTEMRSYIRSCIDPSIYNITEAADGAEGIEKALELIPDLIISDIMMPEKDGFEVTLAIRGHTATSHIPLILLTAKASEESRLKGISRGADAYLTKPFSPEELTLRIKKLIEIRQLLQKRFQGDKDQEASEKNTGYEKEDRFINELRNYINDHIPEPGLSVEAISSHFAISRRQLNRKMRALINTSANHYIQSLRMEKAMQLLQEKQLNITEVAYATGFSSLSYFSKTFKKTYGKNPSEVL